LGLATVFTPRTGNPSSVPIGPRSPQETHRYRGCSSRTWRPG